MGTFFIHNGLLLRSGHAVQDIALRSCRSGEGLFETMRVHGDDIVLDSYHCDRLSDGMRAMGMKPPPQLTCGYIKDQALQVCRANGHQPTARVRLTVFTTEDNLEDGQCDLILESWELPPSYAFRHPGLAMGIYSDAHKTFSATSAYKTNYMLYALAADHARTHQLDDCFILNDKGLVCDASISNVFWIKNGEIATPPLSEGCIAGIMRRHLLDALPKKGFAISEKPLPLSTLLNADEVFLTNVIRGIRPVESFDHKVYGHQLSQEIFTGFIKVFGQ